MELSAHTGDTANKKQKLPHRIFVRQLLLFGFNMYPQSVVFFVRDSGCAVRPAHTPQIKKKTPQTSWGRLPVVGVSRALSDSPQG